MRDGVPYAAGIVRLVGAEHGVPVITYEFPLAATEVLMRDHVPALVELLTGTLP
ncbi:MAG: hypothetical protein IPK33_12880 [Gemmatimonadetes bacterium]|nr:hypothetical protein [Gemmatimonadota bacterium]